ncbi:MAG TPA: helix-turn-helix transcriptional regulator [Streptosporangiaceae bacterium]|nr:helix-turn-helix transcriptional regulator [Streptosporangiaceae bacterium]
MSPDGQCPAEEHDPASAVVVVTFPMPAGRTFDWHTHEDHQLAWAPSGVLSVRTASTAWVLPPSRALWIPAGLRHETLSLGAATMRTAYVRPGLCSLSWPDCTPVAASTLLGELISYLEHPDLDLRRREHAESLLVDLLEPVSMTTIEVRMPAAGPARQVAERLLQSPADDRTLAGWGREFGASERTLARAFVAATGLPFGRWRALFRLQAALPELASGEPVGNVARMVGYESVSAFVAAFRRETGLTPAAYFALQSQPGPAH